METGYFDEWRAANRAASDAERSVVQASLDAIAGKGPLPTEEAVARAKKLRAVADDLFSVAMAEMKDKAGRFRRY